VGFICKDFRLHLAEQFNRAKQRLVVNSKHFSPKFPGAPNWRDVLKRQRPRDVQFPYKASDWRASAFSR
jgi:hypothetical protein